MNIEPSTRNVIKHKEKKLQYTVISQQFIEIIKLKTKKEGNINQKQKWINLKSFNVVKLCADIFFFV